VPVSVSAARHLKKWLPESRRESEGLTALDLGLAALAVVIGQVGAARGRRPRPAAKEPARESTHPEAEEAAEEVELERYEGSRREGGKEERAAEEEGEGDEGRLGRVGCCCCGRWRRAMEGARGRKVMRRTPGCGHGRAQTIARRSGVGAAGTADERMMAGEGQAGADELGSPSAAAGLLAPPPPRAQLESAGSPLAARQRRQSPNARMLLPSLLSFALVAAGSVRAAKAPVGGYCECVTLRLHALVHVCSFSRAREG